MQTFRMDIIINHILYHNQFCTNRRLYSNLLHCPDQLIPFASLAGHTI